MGELELQPLLCAIDRTEMQGSVLTPICQSLIVSSEVTITGLLRIRGHRPGVRTVFSALLVAQMNVELKWFRRPDCPSCEVERRRMCRHVL